MTDTMLAAVWHGPGLENFRLEEVPVPEIGPGDVLLRIRACYFGALSLRAILTGHPKLTPPMVLGRMVSGDVAAVGEGVTTVKVGDRITVDPVASCGHCFYCENNEPTHCLNQTKLSPGGLATYTRIAAPLVPGIVGLADDVSYEEGAYSDTLGPVLQGMEKANVRHGDTVVLIGCGGVGLTFIPLLKGAGAAQIIAADVEDQALDAAEAAGATHTVNTLRQDLGTVARDLTQGRGADVVVEAVGRAATYRLCFDVVRYAGTIVGFGGCPPETTMELDPNLIHYGSLRILGTSHCSPAIFRRAVALINAGFDLSHIITHRLSLEDVHQAIEVFPQVECKTLVIMP